MDPRPGSKTGSVLFFGSGGWRDRINLNNMSISELVSELRDTFLRSDFDRVEEALVAREAMLKAEIEEKKREIGMLQEKVQFERLEKISVELELKRVKGERHENGNGFGLDGKVVKAELGGEGCKVEVLNNGGVGAVAELEGEKVAEKKRLVGEPSKKDGLGASGTVIDIEDSDEDERSSPQATFNRKETTSCVIADNEHRSSPGAFQKNLATRQAVPIGILKREFASSRGFGTNINDILDALDGDTSSSSSSSSSSAGTLDMDFLPLKSRPSNKKMRTDAANLGWNS